MIYKFTKFLLEHSKLNDPMPELTWDKSKKTAIFIFGMPGAGKSTFTQQFLIPKLKNYKIFDPDEYISKLIKIGKTPYKRSEEEKQKKFNNIRNTIEQLKKDYNISVDMSDEQIQNMIDNNLYVDSLNSVLDKTIEKYMKTSNADFIFDTTGNDFDKITKYSQIAKENGYSVLFIKVRTSLENAINNNLNRERQVQLDYQIDSIVRSEELEREYLKLLPNAYYIFEGDINCLFKFENGDLRLKKENVL